MANELVAWDLRDLSSVVEIEGTGKVPVPIWNGEIPSLAAKVQPVKHKLVIAATMFWWRGGDAHEPGPYLILNR